MTVDFHVHSTASDGTCSPTELALRSAQFDAVALTDHDNADGVAEFCSAAVGSRRRFAGIELSIFPGDGFDRFHLLGLGIDPCEPRLKEFLRKILDGRNERNRRIVENFARLGIDLGSDIASYAHGEVLARPHFARWLVDHGHAADVRTAFARYLASDSPVETRCYEPRWRPSQEEAFAAVHGAGGICIMAHPKFWRDGWRRTGPDYIAVARELAVLREKGLDGVETLYQANTPAENVEFSRIALEAGLLTSAGSDFHGANKADIPLGMQVDEHFIAPLLEALRR